MFTVLTALLQAPQTGLEPNPVPFYAKVEFGALLVALLARGVSMYAVVLSKRVARRSGVIDLHNAWKDVNAIDPAHLIGPDVRAAVNALDLTASLWNHDVIDQQILFQHYWGDFKELYEVLSNIDTVVPGYRKTGRECLTPAIRKTYRDMEQWELRAVPRSSL